MPISEVNANNLQQSLIKNVKLDTKCNVTNIVYVEAQIQMSNIWHCKISFTSEQNQNLINQLATVTIQYHHDDVDLKLNGIITQQEISILSDDCTLEITTITIHMQLILCKGNQNNRVFTEKNIDEIIATTISSSQMQANIQLQSNTQITICQFNETDLDFFHKICNHLGIFYFHDFITNQLIISDDINIFTTVTYKNNSSPALQILSSQLSFDTTSVYNIEKTRINTTQNSFSTTTQYSSTNKKEIYTQRLCTTEHAQQIAINLQNSNNQQTLSIYNVFTVKYCVGTIIQDEIIHKFEFLCFPLKKHLKCTIYTYKPLTYILPTMPIKRQQQTFTGIVVADDNQPALDELNYVPVKLHFDNSEETNFIKARISHRSSGTNYGTWFVPRGGQEVIVIFLDDLLSSAIIIGSLYSDDIVPQYNPQDSTNQSYWRGESIGNTGQKNKENFFANEIFMDDTSGEELIRIGARLKCEFFVTQSMSMIVQEETDAKLKTVSIELETLELKETKNTTINSKTTSVEVEKDYSLKANNIIVETTKDTQAKSANTKIEAQQNIEVKCTSFKLDAQQIEIQGETQIQIKCGATTIAIEPSSLTIQTTSLSHQATSANLTWQTTTFNGTAFTINSATFTLQSSTNTIMGATNSIIGMTSLL